MAPVIPDRPRPPRVRPERRRRSDVVVAAALTVLLVGVTIVLWVTSDVAHTSSVEAADPIAPPPAAAGMPAAVTEAWRAPSGATVAPVVAGPAAVTADGGLVVGRDALTGEVRWSYERDRQLCTVAAGFPRADQGRGRVLALYAEDSEWCSELTALRPDTGARAAASNPDVRPGTQLLASGSSVVATGPNYLEVMRSDLVKTLEYGAVPIPVQVKAQPRPQCTHASTALGTDRLGLVERCPGEGSDRLTLVVTDGEKGAEEPEVAFSVLLPGPGAVIVAVSDERVAVALPGPPRLLVYDHAGRQVAEHPLDVPGTDLVDPPGGVAATATRDHRITWWTGSRTIALDDQDLAPQWVVPDALGPAVPYADGWLAPVPGGLRVLDARGAELRTIPVERPSGPVRLATLGEVLLEQRAGEVVALKPA
ncbi:Rv3212 family protein [Pseudonocardia adelaidensis]|uniref:Pyrroloquinoline-quinone binding quinoprotein n=1 Tax=Pseudonocardia adelaidensis TaxID=648754 RepID=A0ABP9NKV5_9PSEU